MAFFPFWCPATSQEFPGENRRVCRKSPLGGKCLCCPSFQGATLFIVTLSDHTVPKGSEEGAGRQSGCSAHFLTTLPFWKEVELWSPACYLLSSVCLDAYPLSRLIGHPLLSQRCEAGGSKVHHLIAVCPWAGHWTSCASVSIYTMVVTVMVQTISLLGGADDVMQWGNTMPSTQEVVPAGSTAVMSFMTSSLKIREVK